MGKMKYYLGFCYYGKIPLLNVRQRQKFFFILTTLKTHLLTGNSTRCHKEVLLVELFPEVCLACFRINPRITLLIGLSIDMKSHHYHSNSYNGITFNWRGLHFQMISPLHHAVAWGHAGRCGVREETKCL